MAEIKATLKLASTERYPNNNGTNAPPTIAVHSNPEPCGFKSPKPSIAKLKIVGNIIELNSPTANTAHNAIKPDVDIEITISKIAATENKLNTFWGW